MDSPPGGAGACSSAAMVREVGRFAFGGKCARAGASGAGKRGATRLRLPQGVSRASWRGAQAPVNDTGSKGSWSPFECHVAPTCMSLEGRPFFLAPSAYARRKWPCTHLHRGSRFVLTTTPPVTFLPVSPANHHEPLLSLSLDQRAAARLARDVASLHVQLSQLSPRRSGLVHCVSYGRLETIDAPTALACQTRG